MEEKECSALEITVEEVEMELLNNHWRKLMAMYPELETPCFTCDHFYECNADSKHDPLMCLFLNEWYARSLQLGSRAEVSER